MRRAVALLALAFLVLPLALLAVGVRGDAFENRVPEQAPRAGDGWGALSQTGRYVADRLPGRRAAVRANRAIAEDLYGVPPRLEGPEGALPFAPADGQDAATGEGLDRRPARALEGRDGFLFLEEELQRACERPVGEVAAVARLRAFADAVEASGRRAVVLVAPDKSAVLGDLLPARYPQRDCAPRGQAALGRALGAQRDPRVVALREPVAALRRTLPAREVFYRTDTHWTQRGAFPYVRAVVRGARGDAAVAARGRDLVEAAPRDFVGDLTRVQGDPRVTRERVFVVRRAGGGRVQREAVTVAGIAGQRTRIEGGQAPVVQGRTLLLADSFGLTVPDLLPPYFADLTALSWGSGQAATLRDAIAGADTVVLQIVEREVVRQAAFDGPGLLSEELLASVRALPPPAG